MEVLEFKPSGVDPAKVLESAGIELKEGNTRHMMVISLDKDGVPCIFSTSMNRMEYATMALAAQDLALCALRGHIIEEADEPEPTPPGGPAS